MSWFQSDQPKGKLEPSQTATGQYKPMDRVERQACWSARDTYFSCLDRSNVVDALKESTAANANCGSQSEAFDRDCAASWVRYFKQKRVAEWEKEQKIKKLEAEGAIPADQTLKPWYKVW